MKQFYSHIIEIESISLELDKLDLSDDQKMHLAKIVDSSLHHVVLDAILSELSDSDKRVFLQHVNDNNHDKIWKFLNQKVDNIEEKIKKAADDLKTELRSDLKKAKKT